jgi:large subunit ribosomal protein L15
MEKYSLIKPMSYKTKKRVGRGPGSGMGKTSTRGQKGQMSRSGSKRRAWFEGGQMPLQRRVPKRGFNNIFKKEYQLINLEQLQKVHTQELNPETMKKLGLVKSSKKAIKILGNGTIDSAITVVADAFSKNAKEKIEKANGKAELRTKKTNQE